MLTSNVTWSMKDLITLSSESRLLELIVSWDGLSRVSLACETIDLFLVTIPSVHTVVKRIQTKSTLSNYTLNLLLQACEKLKWPCVSELSHAQYIISPTPS